MSASWCEIVLARRGLAILGARRLPRRLHWTGAVLAAIALLLRLAIPAPTPVLAADAGNIAALFDEHYLCRTAADGAPTPDTPATHDHDTTCCLWHALAGGTLLPTTAAEPVVFATVFAVAPVAPALWVPTLLPGTARARAPPARA